MQFTVVIITGLIAGVPLILVFMPALYAALARRPAPTAKDARPRRDSLPGFSYADDPVWSPQDRDQL